MRILFIELLGGIGDVVLALPAIHGLARTHAPAHMAVLTFRPGDRLLSTDPLVQQVIGVARSDRADAAVARVLADPWDLIVSDTRHSGIPGLVTRSQAAATVDDLWRRPPPDEPIDRRFVRLLVEDGLIDGRVADSRPAIHVTSAERASGRELLESLLPRSSRRLMLMPDAGMAIKRWSPGRWRTLAMRARGELGAACCVVGGADPQLAQRLARDGAVPLPALTLRELAATAAAADACVGGDTGPVRIAAAMGTPTVGLFGPTVPGRFGLASPHVNLMTDVSCPEREPANMTEQACWWSGRCIYDTRKTCVDDITVDAVVSALGALPLTAKNDASTLRRSSRARKWW